MINLIMVSNCRKRVPPHRKRRNRARLGRILKTTWRKVHITSNSNTNRWWPLQVRLLKLSWQIRRCRNLVRSKRMNLTLSIIMYRRKSPEEILTKMMVITASWVKIAQTPERKNNSWREISLLLFLPNRTLYPLIKLISKSSKWNFACSRENKKCKQPELRRCKIEWDLIKMRPLWHQPVKIYFRPKILDIVLTLGQ